MAKSLKTKTPYAVHVLDPDSEASKAIVRGFLNFGKTPKLGIVEKAQRLAVIANAQAQKEREEFAQRKKEREERLSQARIAMRNLIENEIAGVGGFCVNFSDCNRNEICNIRHIETTGNCMNQPVGSIYVEEGTYESAGRTYHRVLLLLRRYRDEVVVGQDVFESDELVDSMLKFSDKLADYLKRFF